MKKRIGEIGVDAGLCWIGDPCYIHKEKGGDNYKEWGETWSEFCKILEKKERQDDGSRKVYSQFNYDKGHAGLGVCVGTGYGDGMYPVYANFNEEGRITSVTVKFI